MEIRNAVAADADDIVRLLYQVNQVHADLRPDLFKDGGNKYTKEQVLEILSKPDVRIYVAADGECVIGYAICMIEEVEDTASRKGLRSFYLDDLCVDENSRGQHAGSLLFAHVKKEAKSLGAGQITLHVWTGNEAAESFYESMGMKPMYTAMDLML
ncbi:MAG: GNAT family N-acetyltransferase [Lachnospiraceae bacterium]|nr:GNAT family N-acetyltransferase [Lachnospiraceae bacterium]